MVEALEEKTAQGEEQLGAAAEDALLIMPQDVDEARPILSAAEQEQLDSSLRYFHDAKESIERCFGQKSVQIAQEKDPKVIRQLIDQCFGKVIDASLYAVPYNSAIALLNEAQNDLCDSQAQPQDLKEDIDFYGQIERLTEQFVVDIRRAEMASRQHEEIKAKLHRDQEIANEKLQAELEAKEKQLKEEQGDDFNEDHESIKELRLAQQQLNEAFLQQIKETEETKAEALNHVETQRKVIDNLRQAFDTQKNHIIDTKLAFNFDKCVKDVRASLTFMGATRDHELVTKQVQWPYLEALKNPKLELFEQERLLSQLRITKVEWATVDVICSLKFYFSNGTASPQLGLKVPLQESVTLKENQEIKKIYVCQRDNLNYMEAMVLVDQSDQLIARFAGEQVTGSWVTLELGPYEQVIAVKASTCDRYVRGIGFFLWKPGMGLPSYKAEQQLTFLEDRKKDA